MVTGLGSTYGAAASIVVAEEFNLVRSDYAFGERRCQMRRLDLEITGDSRGHRYSWTSHGLLRATDDFSSWGCENGLRTTA